jgi:hypothetical protein
MENKELEEFIKTQKETLDHFLSKSLGIEESKARFF